MTEMPSHGCPRSRYIAHAKFSKHRQHYGSGDMWPMTWAADDHLYAAAGDNMGSPMNFWRIEGDRWSPAVWHMDNLPVDPSKYCDSPPSDPVNGIKPAGLLSVNGILYFAVEAMHYGENPAFNRQRNLHGWIVTSTNFGKTWNREATPTHFFTGRLSSCHFLQFGRDYAGARDAYVYAYFSGADDGNSYWENGDYILLGRVPSDRILERQSWEFCTAINADNKPDWSPDDSRAVPVFRYPRMTGENHVSYCAFLGRYLMGNYSFTDEYGRPRPYHQQVIDEWNGKLQNARAPSQLTLFESPTPWGPWSLFHREDDWGQIGDYQPVFPTKWMSKEGNELWMVSSGSREDYNFTTQKLNLELDERYK